MIDERPPAAVVSTIAFVSSALGVVVVGVFVGIPLPQLLVLAAVVGVLFAAGNLLVERWR